MINYLSGDVYLSNDVDIIFNPVGVRDNYKGFLRKVKHLYPSAYLSYKDEAWSCGIKELLGEIQLVRIDSKRLMMNGFCLDKKGKINKLALTKTLVELCNLAYEYDLSVGLEHRLGLRESAEADWIYTIIKTVFDDVDISVTVYDRYDYKS